jgi:membrane-bound lytic murein transglycosylase F
MMLAAYNVGLGHLYDARTLTKEQGGNRSQWIDVRERLPLLNKKKWFSKTRRGFARGREAVQYVENIRSYYDVLVWYTNKRDGIDTAPIIEENPVTEPEPTAKPPITAPSSL